MVSVVLLAGLAGIDRLTVIIRPSADVVVVVVEETVTPSS